MEELKKKYKPMENVLNNINGTIGLSKVEVARNNRIIEQVTKNMMNLMKQKDPLFDEMFEHIFYGGSFYDKLKVDQPNEYDVDLVLNLPALSKPCIRCSHLPGFVRVEVQEYAKILTMAENKRKSFEKLHTLLSGTEKYLSTFKVLRWMERIITLVFNGMPKNEASETYVDVVLDKSTEPLRIYLTLSKVGPGFTLKLSGKNLRLDIDLVPSFQFTKKEHWPSSSGGYKPNTSTTNKDKFLVVPKTPTGDDNEHLEDKDQYWRLSFQEQERELISQDLKTLKPSLRLLKKLRDKQKHKIASYFIKTIFLWTLEEEEKSFWTQTLSVVFMSMLTKYATQVREKTIPYYWNSGYNLIACLKDATKVDLANSLNNIIDDVERHLIEPVIDPFKIGKYMLLPEEVEQLRENVTLGNKVKRSISIATAISALQSPKAGPSVDTTDSKSDKSSPLVTKLNFGQSEADSVKLFSDSYEERQKRESEYIMAQLNGRFSNEILECLKKIDEKMDKMLERFEKSDETNRETNLKLVSLEKQMEQLQLENMALKISMMKTEKRDVCLINPMDTIMNNGQIEDDSAFKH